MPGNHSLLSLFLCSLYLIPFGMQADTLKLEFLKDEYWWGGISARGHETPYTATSKASYDLYGQNFGNQAQPLLFSSKGRYVWSEEPIAYTFDRGTITVTTRAGEIISGQHGNSLPEVYAYVSNRFFPSDGRIPDPLLFSAPQYNTWIELMYDQNEEDILAYAEAIIAHGYPPGVLMIDDNWQEDYGTWEFSQRRFKDPKGMMQKLHALGFKVMLWVCPFVSPDSVDFRYLAAEGMLILDPQQTQEILWANTKNKAAVVRWWNGASAVVDLSNPKAMACFKERLDYLVDEFGVDGFKFDAGDARFYVNGVVSFNSEITPNDHTAFFAELGLQYPLNEYRASWKMAGLPLAQRLRDKGHDWGDLAKLIPDLMSQSVMGYAYTCPDMIGGGEYQSFLKGAIIDEELIVRSAQVHALMPMMQFSVAPWRVLSPENAAICLEMAMLHQANGELILELAHAASRSGEPIVKPMEFAFPGMGYETIQDQFVLGNDTIVAPVVEQGARSREVALPNGIWRAEDGMLYTGGRTIVIDVPLERLPYFTRIDATVLEAENHSNQQGVETLGDRVADIHDGDWLLFRNVDFGAGKVTFEALAAMGNEQVGRGGWIEVRLGSADGKLIGRNLINHVEVGVGNLQTRRTPITETRGVHDVYLVFKQPSPDSENLFELDQIRFTNEAMQTIGNPIITHVRTADPSVHVFEHFDGDKYWMYPSNDVPDAMGYFSMDGYRVFSSNDLKNWTDHGQILHSSQISWGHKDGGWMWAPDANYKDGKYYFYFPHKIDSPRGAKESDWATGVAISDHPAGPFEPMDTWIEGTEGTDPACFIDDDGTAYLFFGNMRVARLMPNMVELDPTLEGVGPKGHKKVIVKDLPKFRFMEGAWMHKHNGKYYYSWKQADGSEFDGYYAIGDSPHGEFQFMGPLNRKPNRAQDHHSIVQIEGQWYYFYHVGGAGPRPANRRMVCVDYLYHNPDGTIQMVKMTNDGVLPVRKSNTEAQ